ncbi:MAG: ThuA domain-containing protein [Verrucomicrobiota bacterium]|nr:ThuA domain-containing protein [Verrucomicrobiota bacterium]
MKNVQRHRPSLGSARHSIVGLAIVGLLISVAFCQQLWESQAADKENAPLRVLVITGGHDYETNLFYRMFDGFSGMTYQAAAHPKAHDWLKSDKAAQYDVIVLYDMWQEISDTAKDDFVNRLKQGKGLVVLHHALASYQAWPEYEKIIGGKYYLQKTVVAGIEKPMSTYLHDVTFKVKVLDKTHPVTRGVSDFEIHDETYNLFDVSPNVVRLLGTDAPTSGKVIGWANSYEGAKVVYLQLGHDHLAWENPAFQKLLSQAIRWTAGRE